MKRTDLFALSIYDSKVIDKYELNPWKGLPSFLDSNSLSSFDVHANNLIVQQKGFFLNKPITSLGVTQSRRGITQRNILVGTMTGQVNAVDLRFLDPRRPVGTLSKQEVEEGLIGYFAEVPLIPFSTITYYNTVEMINNIQTFPTKLESTCLVLVTGLDLFYSRLQPSEGFDLIAEEFNYPLLIMMTIALFVITILAHRAVKKQKLNKRWK